MSEKVEEKAKEWKCRHCLFIKKDMDHGGVRVCFFGGASVPVEPNKDACVNFHPSRRARAVGKYRSRVEAGLVGAQPEKKKKVPDKMITAKEMLKLLEKHLVRKPEEVQPKKREICMPLLPMIDGTPWPKEERTNAFKEQMCAGRCCKRKEICKHYESWIEHGKPQNSMKMIRSIAHCIDDVESNAQRHYSRFLPIDGASEDDVMEFAEVM